MRKRDVEKKIATIGIGATEEKNRSEKMRLQFKAIVCCSTAMHEGAIAVIVVR